MTSDRERSVLLGSVLAGVGIGAVVDVLLFHLILQWHHLRSATIPPDTLAGLRTNIYYDGLFALSMLAVALLGGAVLWRAAARSSTPPSSARLFGGVLVGAGAFNLFDGVVDHYLLHIHDVVHGSRALNPHWIGASLLLLGLGVLALAR